MQDECVQLGPFRYRNLVQRQVTILRNIYPYFTDEVISRIVMPLVQQDCGISLRALDWLVTNYSKKWNLVCTNKVGNIFNIHHGYKVALSHYRRRNFDPFRRRNRIDICDKHGAVVCETTVGQCNFLLWADVNGVLLYAHTYAKEIEADMNSMSAWHKSQKRKERISGKPHRRQELSNAPRTTCSVYEVQTSVTFDYIASDSEVGVGSA